MSDSEFVLAIDKDTEEIHAVSVLKAKQKKNNYMIIGNIKSSNGEDRGLVKCKWCSINKRWEIILFSCHNVPYSREQKEIKVECFGSTLEGALGQLSNGLKKYMEQYKEEECSIEV